MPRHRYNSAFEEIQSIISNSEMSFVEQRQLIQAIGKLVDEYTSELKDTILTTFERISKQQENL